jgi:hypothetical protein
LIFIAFLKDCLPPSYIFKKWKKIIYINYHSFICDFPIRNWWHRNPGYFAVFFSRITFIVVAFGATTTTIVTPFIFPIPVMVMFRFVFQPSFVMLVYRSWNMEIIRNFVIFLTIVPLFISISTMFPIFWFFMAVMFLVASIHYVWSSHSIQLFYIWKMSNFLYSRKSQQIIGYVCVGYSPNQSRSRCAIYCTHALPCHAVSPMPCI